MLAITLLNSHMQRNHFHNRTTTAKKQKITGKSGSTFSKDMCDAIFPTHIKLFRLAQHLY